MRLALLAITAAALFGQSPEIRGIVVEQSSGAGLAGVEVTLALNPLQTPHVVATTFTDGAGNFQFKPETFGQYGVEAKKPGYSLARGGFVSSTAFVSADFPIWRPRIELMNPSSVTGRFLDEQDRPMSGLRVSVVNVNGLSGGGATTGADGTFTARNLPSGAYLIRMERGAATPKIEEYTDEAFQETDSGYEDLIWPSGVSDSRAAVPLIVAPGGVTDMGTIRLRQADFYRVRLNIQGDCSGGGWRAGIFAGGVKTTGLSAFCKQQLLLTGIPPGSYDFALWSDGENNSWAVAPLVVTRSNTVLNLTLAPPTDVPGRIVTSMGVTPPLFSGKGFLLMMRPDLPGLDTFDPQEPQVLNDGTFIAHDLRWDRYRVSAQHVPESYYVREIRYNGRPVTDGRITLLPGAMLEFELDNQPARVTGTVTEGGKPLVGLAFVALAKAPYDASVNTREANAPYSYRAPVNGGRFDLTGLAPGEYRITVASEIDTLTQRLPTGEKITLERGQQVTVELKLK